MGRRGEFEERCARRFVSRREVAAALAVVAATAAGVVRTARSAAPRDPVVDTTAGKVRGEPGAGGGYRFLCVPYGASTAGAGRFMPPRPPVPWAGVRGPLQHALISPQLNPNAPVAPAGSVRAAVSGIGSEAGSLETEDCLNVTIYTPGLDSHRRPVMFWCHGGGYYAGSGSNPMYDGSRLAVRGDVVVVNVNHRLGVLGFSQLAAAGPGFAPSGNVGMMDIALALRWVQENIERFGGDPRNVMIFGQSGGGGKVAVLLSMPSAKGLFHRAAMQSGALRRLRSMEHAAFVSATLMSRLGLRLEEARRLQQVPLPQLMQAFFSLAKLPAQPGRALNYEPVLDGQVVPRNPFDPIADPLNAAVPLVVGCARTENTAFMLGDEAAFRLDAAALKSRMQALIGERAGSAAIALYSRLEPAASPSDLYFAMLSDRTRRQSILVAELKSAQMAQVAQVAAPAYLYELLWNTPVFGGMLRSPHSLDLPMIFDLARGPRWTPYTGGGPGAQQVAEAMSAAWVAFVRTGDPATAVHSWPAYLLEGGPGGREARAPGTMLRETMLFDEVSGARPDPMRETRLFWDDVANGVI